MVETGMKILKKINIKEHDRYIELMIGSGQSLRLLHPKQTCYLNDSNTDLINFYKNLNDPRLKQQLEQFSINWELIEQFSTFSSAEILMAFDDFNKDIISSEDLNFVIRAIIMMNMDHENFNSLFEKEFIVSIDMFSNALIKAIESTLIKLKGCPSENINNEDFLKNEITLSFKFGFYDHFKSLINFQKTELIDCLTLDKHLAIWYFLKENTKSQQLQYDQNGNLKNQFYSNLPKSLSFSKNVNMICSKQFTDYINNANLYNSNPIDFINEIKPATNDILVLNLMNNNLILSSGKNTIRNQNHMDLINRMIKLESNLIIISNDSHLINLCKTQAGEHLEIETHNEGSFAIRIN